MDGTIIQLNNSLSANNNIKDRQLLIGQIRQWADLNTDAALDVNSQIFRDPSIEGFIAYRKTARYVVIYGDPICATQDKLLLAQAFKEYCKQKKLVIIYTIVSDTFAKSVPTSLCRIKIQFGSRLVINPSIDPLKLTGSNAVLLRKKVKHATKDGAVVLEYLSYDANIETDVESITKEWLHSRQGPQVFIAHMNLFSDREGKRWFIARVGKKIVGLLVLNQLIACSGWLLNNLMVTKDAPVGTSELLVTAVFKVLQEERCARVVVGPVTGHQLKNVIGMNPFSIWFLNCMFKSAKKMFRLDGQTHFWEKFQPDTSPSYLLFESFNICTLVALITAFNVQITK